MTTPKPPPDDTPILELRSLTVRFQNIFHHNRGLRTAGDLRKLSDSDVLKTPGVGRKGLRLLRQVLNDTGPCGAVNPSWRASVRCWLDRDHPGPHTDGHLNHWPADEGPRPTDRQIELHGQLLRWFMWWTQGIGDPSPCPDADLVELLEAQRAVGKWTPRSPSGGKRVHLVIDDSSLALEWGAARRLGGFQDGADVPGAEVRLDRATANVVLEVAGRELPFRLADARELAHALLGAVTEALEVPRAG